MALLSFCLLVTYAPCVSLSAECHATAGRDWWQHELDSGRIASIIEGEVHPSHNVPHRRATILVLNADSPQVVRGTWSASLLSEHTDSMWRKGGNHQY